MAFFAKNSNGSPVQSVGQDANDPHKRNENKTILCSCEGCNEPADVAMGGKDLCNFHFACREYPDLMTRELQANSDIVKIAKAYDSTKNPVLRSMIFTEFVGRVSERHLNSYRVLTAEGALEWFDFPLPKPLSACRHPSRFVPPSYYLQDLLCKRIEAAVAISRAKKGREPAISQEERAKRQFHDLMEKLTKSKPSAPLYDDVPFPEYEC